MFYNISVQGSELNAEALLESSIATFNSSSLCVCAHLTAKPENLLRNYNIETTAGNIIINAARTVPTHIRSSVQ